MRGRGDGLCVDFGYLGIEALSGIGCFILTRATNRGEQIVRIAYRQGRITSRDWSRMYDPDTTARSSTQRMIRRNALMLSTFP